MNRQPAYKTLADGSIDYAHYIGRSHEIRSLEAHALIRRVGAFLAGLLSRRAPRAASAAPNPPLRAGRTPSPRRARPGAVHPDRAAPSRAQ